MEETGRTPVTLTSDVEAVREFLGGPGVRYVCSPERGPAPSLVADDLAYERLAIAQDPSGRVQAAAWLERSDEAPGQAVALLALSPPLPRFPNAARMLGQLAEEAESLGIRQITTCITNDVTDLEAAFREAGLHVVSRFAIGGSMKVVLEREQDEGPRRS